MTAPAANSERYARVREAFDWRPKYEDPQTFYRGRQMMQDSLERFADPFELLFDGYMKIQAEKQRSLWSGFDMLSRFGLNRNIEHRWHEWTRLIYAALSQGEYAISTAFGRLIRHIPGGSVKLAMMGQVIDELRHATIQRKASLMIADDSDKDHIPYADREWQNSWLVQAYRTYFEEIAALSRTSPLETIFGLSFHLEVGISNTVFSALVQTIALADDLTTAQMYMSVQSDETRHMALGYNIFHHVIQHATEAEKKEIDWWNQKWMWRCYRALGPATGFTADVYSTRKGGSFKEYMNAYMIQFYENIEMELTGNGFAPIAWLEDVHVDMECFTHALWQALYANRQTSFVRVPKVTKKDRKWLIQKYPHWEEQYGTWWDEVDAGDDKLGGPPPVVCQVCQLPCVFPRYDAPVIHHASHAGTTYSFCSRPCRAIFEHDPAIYLAPTIGDRTGAQFASGRPIEEILAWAGVPAHVAQDDFLMREDEQSRPLPVG